MNVLNLCQLPSRTNLPVRSQWTLRANKDVSLASFVRVAAQLQVSILKRWLTCFSPGSPLGLHHYRRILSCIVLRRVRHFENSANMCFVPRPSFGPLADTGNEIADCGQRSTRRFLGAKCSLNFSPNQINQLFILLKNRKACPFNSSLLSMDQSVGTQNATLNNSPSKHLDFCAGPLWHSAEEWIVHLSTYFIF